MVVDGSQRLYTVEQLLLMSDERHSERAGQLVTRQSCQLTHARVAAAREVLTVPAHLQLRQPVVDAVAASRRRSQRGRRRS